MIVSAKHNSLMRIGVKCGPKSLITQAIQVDVIKLLCHGKLSWSVFFRGKQTFCSLMNELSNSVSV